MISIRICTFRFLVFDIYLATETLEMSYHFWNFLIWSFWPWFKSQDPQEAPILKAPGPKDVHDAANLKCNVYQGTSHFLWLLFFAIRGSSILWSLIDVTGTRPKSINFSVLFLSEMNMKDILPGITELCRRKSHQGALIFMQKKILPGSTGLYRHT